MGEAKLHQVMSSRDRHHVTASRIQSARCPIDSVSAPFAGCERAVGKDYQMISRLGDALEGVKPCDPFCWWQVIVAVDEARSTRQRAKALFQDRIIALVG